MKEIKLDCFLGTESCAVISSQNKLILDNPTDRELTLEVFNHRDDDCQLVVTAKNLKQETTALLSQTNLLITSDEQLIFQDNLAEFLTKNIDFQLITAQTNRKYLFNFDFLNLILAKEKKFLITFDLYFDFRCQKAQMKVDAPEASQRTVATENEAIDQTSQTAVLAANDGVKEQLTVNSKITNQTNSFWFSTLFYLLSGLFIIIFFVIIKFVHGKKSKKKQKKS